jgi:hypothetical protein
LGVGSTARRRARVFRIFESRDRAALLRDRTGGARLRDWQLLKTALARRWRTPLPLYAFATMQREHGAGTSTPRPERWRRFGPATSPDQGFGP